MSPPQPTCPCCPGTGAVPTAFASQRIGLERDSTLGEMCKEVKGQASGGPGKGVLVGDQDTYGKSWHNSCVVTRVNCGHNKGDDEASSLPCSVFLFHCC